MTSNLVNKIEKVGVLGLGIMGSAYMTRLLSAGVEVAVASRAIKQKDNLPNMVRISNSIEDLIINCDIIIIALSDYTAIKTMLFNRKYFFKSPIKRLCFIQMATIHPSQSLVIEKFIQEMGYRYLEAPIQGSSPDVLNGTATIICGGSSDTYYDYKWLFDIFASNVFYVGSSRSAAGIKLAINFMLAIETIAFSIATESIERNGTGADIFLKILRHTAVYAKTFDKKASRHRDSDYEHPNFTLKNMIKDIHLFKVLLEESEIDGDLVKTVIRKFRLAAQAGHDKSDYSVVRQFVSE